MSGVIYFHPQREKTHFGNGGIAYHDHIGNHNQDPYIWNDKFLHSYCHITQSRNDIGQVNFWVSTNNLNKIEKILCDLVFVVGEKHYWENANHIDISNSLVDNKQAFDEHYNYHSDHRYNKRKRYTLKADPISSFQPQDENSNLIDILPFINFIGITTEWIEANCKSGWNSKPIKLSVENTQELYNYLFETAFVRLSGTDFKKLRFEVITDTKNKKVC